MNKIIKQADKIAPRNCVYCTTFQNCVQLINVCNLLNKKAENSVNVGQAKGIVSETYQKGLVHLVLPQPNKKNEFPLKIYNCCSCCCQALQEL